MDELDKAIENLGKKPARRLRAIKGEGGYKPPAAWGLVLDDHGRIDPCLHNASTLIRHAHELRDVVVYDDFSGRVLVREPGKADRPLEEADELSCARWMQRNYNSRFALGTVQHALRDHAFTRRIDVLTEYVRSIRWDGVPRVDTFAPRYLDTEDTPYTRDVGRVLLLSMAARALHPGCKVDTIPVLEGGQGVRKSTCIAVLGGKFFAELEGQLGTKEAAEQLEGAWVVELPELQSLSRAEVTAIKAFASRRSDRFRRAYGRTVSDVPRRSVMIGTTNADTYLRDETGARRFPPLRVRTAIDIDALTADRDQLIAEAVARVEGGERWHITDPGILAQAAEAAAERYETDPWADSLASFLAVRQTVTVAEVLAQLGVQAAQRTQREQTRAAKVLVTLGFRRSKMRAGEKRWWAYVRDITLGDARKTETNGTQSDGVGPGKTEQYQQEVLLVPEVPLSSGDFACARAGELLENGGDSGTGGTVGPAHCVNDDDLSGPWDQ